MLRRINQTHESPQLQIPFRSDNGLDMLAGIPCQIRQEEHCDEMIAHYNADGSLKTQDQLYKALEEAYLPRRAVGVVHEDHLTESDCDSDLDVETLSTASEELETSLEPKRVSINDSLRSKNEVK